MDVMRDVQYCVVPSVRGKEQSRYPNAIKSEIQKLADDNFKEITLLGQNIDAYGRDLPGTTKEGRKENTLTDLLYYIHDVKGCLLYTSPSPRDGCRSRMPSSA